MDQLAKPASSWRVARKQAETDGSLSARMPRTIHDGSRWSLELKESSPTIRPGDDKGKVLRHQNLLLEKLRQENEELRATLSVEVLRVSNSATAPAEDPHEISRLEDEADKFTAKIENQKKHLDEMNAKIEELQKAVVVARRNARPPAQMRTSAHSKQIKKLTHQLSEATRKRNEAATRNERQSSVITEKRKEQALMKSVLAKRKAELAEYDAEMGRLKEETRKNLDMRKDMQEKISRHRATVEKREADFLTECRHISNELQEFVIAESKLLMGVHQRPNMPTHLGKLHKEEEDELRAKLAKGREQLTKDTEEAARLRQQMDEYHELHSKISQATGFKDVEGFVKQFLDTEDENFHRFQYLNTLNAEYESLCEEIDSLRRSENSHVSHEASTDRKWEQMVIAMEAQLEIIDGQTHEQDQNLDTLCSAIAKLASKINAMYKSLVSDGVDNDNERCVESGEDVAESELMAQLGLIEDRATELVRIHGSLQHGVPLSLSSSSTSKSVRLGKELPPRASIATRELSIVPPPIRDQRQEDEFFVGVAADPDDEKPLNETELRHRVEHWVHEHDRSKTRKQVTVMNMTAPSLQRNSVAKVDKSLGRSTDSSNATANAKPDRLSLFAVDAAPELEPQPAAAPGTDEAAPPTSDLQVDSTDATERAEPTVEPEAAAEPEPAP